ncbi:helicase-related protein, partial [Planktothrix sp.]
LYHGRLSEYPKTSEFSRTNIYKKLKQRDQDQQPYIIITTSAIEVGCDLNAEVLISEICPPENLIQRAGRCNRKGNIPDAKVIVIGTQISNLTNTLDEYAWDNYQKVLKNLTDFDAHKIAECISRSQHIDDYRVVELFSMLHNYVYEQDLTCQNVYDQGLLITRSWTPSATLIYENGEKEPPKITVPIDRLIINKENEYANTDVFERYYDQEKTYWRERSLTYGSAYRKDIIIKISRSHEGAERYEN